MKIKIKIVLIFLLFAIFFLTAGMIFLNFIQYISFPTSMIILSSLIIFVLVLIIYFYITKSSRHTDNSEAPTLPPSNDVEKLIDAKTEQIHNDEVTIEDQQTAILNVLQDVQKEKDISEVLAKELEKFKLAVEGAYDHIVITNSDGVILFANQGVENITGFTKEEVIGKKVGSKETWGGLMEPEFYRNLWDTVKVQKKVFTGNLKNHRKNGEKYDVLASISPILDNNGNVLFFVAIEHDVTKEKAVDKAKSEFVSLASHQLRTPVSSINWYTEMLLNSEVGAINDDQKRYLSEIYTSSKRMGDLINSLLNVSRIELGTFAVDIKLVNINILAKKVIADLAPKIMEDNISFKESFDDNISEINADEKLLRMILENILSNAIKYSNKGGQINFAIHTADIGSDFGGKKLAEKNITILISDEGIGIPIEQHEKIFTKLFRADNAAASRPEGTGLGLYIVKSIVDQSGGQIWFTSEENKGTTFYVTYPMSGMKKKEGTRALI